VHRPLITPRGGGGVRTQIRRRAGCRSRRRGRSPGRPAVAVVAVVAVVAGAPCVPRAHVRTAPFFSACPATCTEQLN
jgi:hypothetical protein